MSLSLEVELELVLPNERRSFEYKHKQTRGGYVIVSFEEHCPVHCSSPQISITKEVVLKEIRQVLSAVFCLQEEMGSVLLRRRDKPESILKQHEMSTENTLCKVKVYSQLASAFVAAAALMLALS